MVPLELLRDEEELQVEMIMSRFEPRDEPETPPDGLPHPRGLRASHLH